MVSERIGRRRFMGILSGSAVAVGVSGFTWQVLKPTEKPAKQVKPSRLVDQMDTIMALGDPVAMGTIAVKRLRELGIQDDVETYAVSDVMHINLAAAQGVGTNDPNHIALIERNVA